MHEFSLAQGALDMALAAARKQANSHIHAIHMRIGPLSGVVVEALEFALTTLAEGTIAEGVRLVVEQVPLTCYCSRCKEVFKARAYSYRCPACQETSMEIRSGREMDLVSIEVS